MMIRNLIKPSFFGFGLPYLCTHSCYCVIYISKRSLFNMLSNATFYLATHAFIYELHVEISSTHQPE